jgi:hypothetical protein
MIRSREKRNRRLDAEHDEARRAIVATNRCECSFARSPGKLPAKCSRENWRCDGRIDLR